MKLTMQDGKGKVILEKESAPRPRMTAEEFARLVMIGRQSDLNDEELYPRLIFAKAAQDQLRAQFGGEAYELFVLMRKGQVAEDAAKNGMSAKDYIARSRQPH